MQQDIASLREEVRVIKNSENNIMKNNPLTIEEVAASSEESSESEKSDN
jgi:hypothetical protein